MFIGGSPGSTAGGVKTVTVTVLLVYVWSNLRSERGCNIMGRRLPDEAIKHVMLYHQSGYGSNGCDFYIIHTAFGSRILCLKFSARWYGRNDYRNYKGLIGSFTHCHYTAYVLRPNRKYVICTFSTENVLHQ